MKVTSYAQAHPKAPRAPAGSSPSSPSIEEPNEEERRLSDAQVRVLFEPETIPAAARGFYDRVRFRAAFFNGALPEVGDLVEFTIDGRDDVFRWRCTEHVFDWGCTLERVKA